MSNKRLDNDTAYRIMGVDPGTNYVGYGVIELCGKSVRGVVMGDIDLHSERDAYAKLGIIFKRIGELIDEFQPQEVAFESPFFGENVQSMLKLGRAQGVAMAAAVSRGLAVSEYAPRRVKQSITGRGNASKEQVAMFIRSTLGVDTLPRRLDATDGMAVALCHYYSSQNPIAALADAPKSKGLGGREKCLKRGGSSSWEQFLQQNPERELKNK